MKKNTNTSTENKAKKKENPICTIFERYVEICKQMKLISQNLSLNERYMKYGLF